MPYITNVSMSDVIAGRFPEWANTNTILIQIQDVDNSGLSKFANVKNRSRFVRVEQFRFDDCDRGANTIQLDDAERIAHVLKFAMVNGYNVVSHCHAGICRSGAVTEVGVMMGFEDVDNRYRQPNILVKNMVRDAAGLGNGYIDASETVGGSW